MTVRINTQKNSTATHSKNQYPTFGIKCVYNSLKIIKKVFTICTDVVKYHLLLNIIMAKNLDKFWKLGVKNFNTHYFDINPNSCLVVQEGNYQYDIKKIVEKFG